MFSDNDMDIKQMKEIITDHLINVLVQTSFNTRFEDFPQKKLG
jgi:hypothetical protein